MSSKYDLDRLLDPYGIKKFQKTISRITNPWKEYSAINTAIPSIPTMYESTTLEAMRKAVVPSIPTMYESTTLEAMRKAVVPSIPAMYDSTALEAMRKAVMPSIPAMYDSTALEAMRKAVVPSIPAMYDSTALEAMRKAVMPSIPAMYDSTALEAMRKTVMPSIPAMYDSTALEAMRKAVMPSIPAMYDSTALEAMRRAASSIAINKSLGLQADIQRLIAAKTLMPDLNAKIFNLHQKLYAIAGITEQRLNQNNFDSTHNYLDPFDEFNEKYNQDVHVDEAAIQTLDLVLHQPETLELISELRNIGVFDTSSGSIFLKYSETLPESKASTILNLILCILLWFAEPIINQYEPIQNLQEKSANFLNGVDGLARITKDCDLKDQPNGLKKISLEKESVVTVYKTNDEIEDGWSKIKFNKDGHDLTGYIRTSELHSLD
ncbi:hypothetical protein OHW48_14135 [Acinetobacter baumannii]|nr:hypothetical protein [Acinetobacter baumannii]